MRFALLTIWFERRRYLPGVLAVAFSGLLIALQVGIFWGLIGIVSVPILRSKADVWVGFPRTRAVDLGRPIPGYWVSRLWAMPEVAMADEYVQGVALWTTASGATETAVVVGCNLDGTGLGPAATLPAKLRSLLREPGTVALDATDRQRVEITDAGQFGQIGGRQVRVVGFSEGMASLTGPFVVCSLPTARQLLGLREDQVTYLLARCHDPAAAPAVVARLRKYPGVSAYAAADFALGSKVHFLTKTKAGVAVTFVALLGLAVGAVVTSQTLFAAIAASVRELAVLRALGIPAGRLRTYVLQQSFCVGVAGLGVGLPLTLAAGALARAAGTNAELAPWILGGTAAVTLAMAVVSGLFAMRSLRMAEPTALLR